MNAGSKFQKKVKLYFLKDSIYENNEHILVTNKTYNNPLLSEMNLKKLYFICLEGIILFFRSLIGFRKSNQTKIAVANLSFIAEKSSYLRFYFGCP